MSRHLELIPYEGGFMKINCWIALCLLSVMITHVYAEAPLKALIVDGQNNHGNWPTTTQMMKKYLTETKLFDVDIATTAKSGTDPNFAPDFKKYNVVVSN